VTIKQTELKLTGSWTVALSWWFNCDCSHNWHCLRCMYWNRQRIAQPAVVYC